MASLPAGSGVPRSEDRLYVLSSARTACTPRKPAAGTRRSSPERGAKYRRMLKLVCLAACCYQADAAQTSPVVVPVASHATTFNALVNVPAFDPSLGTLTRVHLDVKADFVITLRVSNFSGPIDGNAIQ